MGIELQDLLLLKELRRNHPRGGRLLILGDCIHHYTVADLGYSGREQARSGDFAKALGFDSFDTIDIAGEPTIKADLHSPVPIELHHQYDWIIDAGTLFFCFDIVSIWKNILKMLKQDGFIFHLAGMSGYIGRAYYSFSPKTFYDFYGINGFRLLYSGYRVKKSGEQAMSAKLSFENAALRLRRFLTGRLLTPPWVEINRGSLHLTSYSGDILEFEAKASAAQPDLLPNNCMVSCLVERVESRAFTLPVPT